MSETQTSIAQETTAGEQAPAVLKYFGRDVELGSRKVQIIRVERFNLIPKSAQAKTIRDEVTLKIGSQWKKGTRDIIRGLTKEEEKKYLPAIMGVSEKSEKWEEKTLHFWADFSIQVPNNTEGIILETGFHIHKEDGKEEILPIMLNDYMKYQFCLQNGDVANENEDNLSLFSFRLVDKARKQKEEETVFTLKKAVDVTYLKLIRSTDPKDRAKIDWILETSGGEYGDGINTIGLSDVQKEMELEKVKNKDISGFNAILEDKHLELKALIRKAISNNIGTLTLEGNTYFAGNKALGSLTDAIGYYSDPANVRDRQILIEALKR